MSRKTFRKLYRRLRAPSFCRWSYRLTCITPFSAANSSILTAPAKAEVAGWSVLPRTRCLHYLFPVCQSGLRDEWAGCLSD
jgi:hypothetical protein